MWCDGEKFMFNLRFPNELINLKIIDQDLNFVLDLKFELLELEGMKFMFIMILLNCYENSWRCESF
ncbi:hypothetical protein Scep_014364 [Stephania cephalantha]|uniref:Uncharacterized protein n=1 Tax=Stephania cephalantha TaxID=152367 RepID=A0AAP0J161_9MAGN